MRGTMRAVRSVALLAAVALTPGLARARCETPAELRALRVSLLSRLGCATRRVLEGPAGSCTSVAVPVCAGTDVDEIAALVADVPDPIAPNPTQLDRQLRCQVAVARGAARFARLRILELSRHERGQGASRRSFKRVDDACNLAIAVDGGGVRRPRLGGACASLTSDVGPADGPAIARCVRPAMERILQHAVGGPIAPNVVMIMTDDQRWDQMDPLPTVQRELGRFGVTFTESFAPTSLCCPSRASFLTGRLAGHHHVYGNSPPLGGATVFDASQTIPVWLSNAGYATALFGKYMNDYSRLSPAIPPGWTTWNAFVENGDLFFYYTINENGTPVHYGGNFDDYSTDLLGGRVVDFVQAHATTPFFVDFTPFAPHDPAIPAPRHVGRYASEPPARPPNYREDDTALKPVWVQFERAIQTPAIIPRIDQLRIDMLESLLAVDDAAAAILQRLDDLGLTDNTLVFYTSDNGLHLLEHWWAFKNVPYEESIRVPLYMRYPLRQPAPAVQHQMVANIDLAPTILDATGIATTSPIDGRSLFDAIAGAPDWRSDLLLQHWAGVIQLPSQAVRTTRWKYIHTDNSAIDQELYDLLADPWELYNLAYDPARADIVGSLQTRLNELLAQ